MCSCGHASTQHEECLSRRHSPPVPPMAGHSSKPPHNTHHPRQARCGCPILHAPDGMAQLQPHLTHRHSIRTGTSHPLRLPTLHAPDGLIPPHPPHPPHPPSISPMAWLSSSSSSVSSRAICCAVSCAERLAASTLSLAAICGETRVFLMSYALNICVHTVLPVGRAFSIMFPSGVLALTSLLSAASRSLRVLKVAAAPCLRCSASSRASAADSEERSWPCSASAAAAADRS